MKVSLEIDVLFDQRGQLAQIEAAVGSSLGRIEKACRAANLNVERQLDESLSRAAGQVGGIETTFGTAFANAEGALQDFSIYMEGAASGWAEDVAEFSSSAFDTLLQSFIDPTEGRFRGLEGVVTAFGRTMLTVITQAVSESSMQLFSLQELVSSILQGGELNMGSTDGVLGEVPLGFSAGGLLSSVLGTSGLASGDGTGSEVGFAVGSVVGSFTPLTSIGGGALGGAIGNLLSGLGRGPREDDPDITILNAARRLVFAFPQDRATSIAALTDLLDDMFQLRDYVNPAAYQAILDAAGPVGNIRSTLERLPGFDAPLAVAVERALGPLEQAFQGVRFFGAQGASQSDISDTSNIAGALELVLRDLSASLQSDELPRFARGGISPGGWVFTEPSELILNRRQQLNLLGQLDRPEGVSTGPAAAGVINYYEVKNEFNVRQLEPADFERYLRSVRFKNFMVGLGPNRRDVVDVRNVRSFERSIHKVVGRVVK